MVNSFHFPDFDEPYSDCFRCSLEDTLAMVFCLIENLGIAKKKEEKMNFAVEYYKNKPQMQLY